MTIPFSRKVVAGAAGFLLFATMLSACAGGGGSASTDQPTTSGGEVTADNPFGMAEDGVIDAVVFDGGYGYDYVTYAGTVLTALHPGVTVNVTGTSQISGEMQPRFVGGNPPDLLDNQGAQQIPLTTIEAQLLELDDLWSATNYDGNVIRDVVYPGIDDAGTYNGRFIQVNYVMTLYAFYYSASLFEEHGWTPPTTWDGLLDLCSAAKAEGLYLFTWGKEAASYWKWLLIDSAIKQGGTDIIENIANLVPGAWEDPTLQAVLAKFEEVVANGCFVPGGGGTQFTQAQAQWSNDQMALMYYTGSWIENEMKSATAPNFQMTAWPAPVLDEATAALPFSAVQAGASEAFVIPAQGANVAGGLELLRAMLSEDAAAQFAETRLAPTIVMNTVPADGFGSTALASTVQLMTDSGTNTFNWLSGGYDTYYAFGTDELVYWNAFLAGEMTAAELTAAEEGLAANTLSDPNVEHVNYSY